MDIHQLAQLLRAFAAERDWDQFHTPKNLAASISIEAAELLELFQWTRGGSGWDELADEGLRERVQDELADVLLYLIRFADLGGFDLVEAADAKLKKNAQKYPAGAFKGSDRKYNE